MGSFGTFEIAITGDSGKFRAELVKTSNAAKASGKQVADAFEQAQNKLAGLGKNFAGAVIGATGLSLGGAAVVRVFEDMAKAAIDQERSLAQLNATLTLTGHAAGFTAQQLERMGDDIQSRTIFDDDEIRKATTALLRFRDVSGETFREILKLAPDVATALGGNLTEAMTTLARIASGDERAMRSLKDAGVFLSEQNRDLARAMKEAGDEVGAAKLVFDELNKSIGGLSESDNTGTYGSVKRLERAWEDLKKKMGGQLLAPGQADKLTEFLERMQRKFAEVDVDRGAWKNLLDDLRRTGEILGIIDESFAFPDVSPESKALKRAEERTADLGKMIAEQQKQRDKEYTDYKKHLERTAELASTAGAAMLQQEKSSLDLQQDALTFAYSRGESSAEQYYRSLRNLSKANLDAITEDLNKQIEAQLSITGAKIPGTDKPAFNKSEREAAEKRAETLVNQANAARFAFFRQNQQNLQQEQTAVEQLGDAYAELAAKVATAERDTTKEAKVRFERENRKFRREQETLRDTGGPQESQAASDRLRQLDTLGSHVEAQAALNDKAREFALILEQVSTTQGRLALEREQTGQTELDYLTKVGTANQARLGDLRGIAESYRQIALAAKDPAALAAADAMKLKLDELAASANAAANVIRDKFADSFADQFTQVADGTKSVKDAFKDLAKSWVHTINEMAAKQLASAIFGGGAQGGAGGVFGWLASLIGGGGGAAGGHSLGGGGGSAGGLGGLAGSFGNFGGDAGQYAQGLMEELAGAFGFAGGTNFAPGGWAMVGERGPELLRLPRGSQVMPHAQSMQMLGGGGGSAPPVQNFYTTVMPGASTASASQAALRTGREVSLRMRRLG